MSVRTTAKMFSAINAYHAQNQSKVEPGRLNWHFVPALSLNLGGNSGGGGFFALSGSASEMKALRKEEKEESKQEMAAIIGGIVVIAFSFLTGLALGKYRQTQEELNESREYARNKLTDNTDPTERSAINKHIKKVERDFYRSRDILILTAGVLASGIAAFAGGMLGISSLITAGIVAGVAVVALTGFSIALSCTEKEIIFTQQEMRLIQGDNQAAEGKDN